MLMNIAKIMIPKACTVFLNEKQTVRQGWEVMTRNGYTAIPVLDAEQHYIGTVSEGDFLRHVLNTGSLDIMDMENHRVGIPKVYARCHRLYSQSRYERIYA